MKSATDFVGKYAKDHDNTVNFIGKYAKEHDMCLDHNWSVLVATAAGLAVFLISHRGRKESLVTAAFGAISTATATYAALNCATQGAIAEVAEDVKAEAKEILSDDPKINGRTNKPALTGLGN